MSATALSGSDSLMINNRIFADFADANAIELTFPNEIATVKTGKDGNSIYGLNTTGRQAELKIRLVRGAPDDKFMQGLLTQQNANFATFVLLFGSYIKKLGDGGGNQTNDTAVLQGGVFKNQPEMKTNVDGDSEQSVTIYTVRFANAQRVLT